MCVIVALYEKIRGVCAHIYVCVCVCMSELEREGVCVCVCAKVWTDMPVDVYYCGWVARDIIIEMKILIIWIFTLDG